MKKNMLSSLWATLCIGVITLISINLFTFIDAQIIVYISVVWVVIYYGKLICSKLDEIKEEKTNN